MILLIAGASHTGKTLLAQRLMTQFHFPYLSIDHLKMGLIRSGHTTLGPENDDALTAYLWPVIREIIKTAVENNQHLIVEGMYIPFTWKSDFEPAYLAVIRYYCLVMTPGYIQRHFEDIRKYANVIERRPEEPPRMQQTLAAQNAHNLKMCRHFDCNYLLIDSDYQIEIDL